VRVGGGNPRWMHRRMLAVGVDPTSGRADILGRKERIQAQRGGILRNAHPERLVWLVVVQTKSVVGWNSS
jgi:hypothetical protein